MGVLGTLLRAIVGASVSIAAAVVTAKNNSKIQMENHRQKRKERLDDAQSKYLMELQEALSKTMRACFEVHHSDSDYFESVQKETTRPLVPIELDERLRMLNQKINYLKERILDDSLRNKIGEAQEAVGNMALNSKIIMICQ